MNRHPIHLSLYKFRTRGAIWYCFIRLKDMTIVRYGEGTKAAYYAAIAALLPDQAIELGRLIGDRNRNRNRGDNLFRTAAYDVSPKADLHDGPEF